MSPKVNIPIIDIPGQSQRNLGSLLLNQGAETISLPLGSVDISAKVIDRVAQVTVKQVFRNNLKEHMEAVYIFPLAPASAISSFDMKVGDRTIKGVVQERGEARQNYQQAVQSGKRAALMEQERDDVFTVQVGNLPPGEEVAIEISYSERLPFFENGSSELRLPLVVAPRYIPGGAVDRESVGDGVEVDTDLVPDASRISPPRLAQGVDPQTALKLSVEILAEDGSPLTDLSCSQHAVKTDTEVGGGVNISLARIDEKLNRDFVLRWRSTNEKVKTSLMTYCAADGETYGLLSIMPPRRAGYLGAARDIVFILDRSGSMMGVKMTSAVRACSILLNTLGPNDRYAIAAFDNQVDWMPSQHISHFVNADTAGAEAGEKFLRTVTARGGTVLDNAIRSSFDALDNRDSKDGRLPAVVVLTDGEVGNESQILQRIQKEIKDARLFVVGIDTAVNSGLLKRLANLGGGTATFVEPGIQLEGALASIAREIGAPLVTDMQVENLDLTVDRASLSPSRIPDVFSGRASVCFLKLSGEKKGKLCVKGKLANGKAFEEKVKAQNVDMPAIAQLWAKAHIVDLEDQFRISQNNKNALKTQIIELAVKHSLLTKFTAFVVVDESEVVNKTGESRKVVQPVEMPESWQNAGAAMGALMACQSPAPAPAAPGLFDGSGSAVRSKARSVLPPDEGQMSRLRSLASPKHDAAAKDSSGGAGGALGWAEQSSNGPAFSSSPDPYAIAASAAADEWGAPAEQMQNGAWGASYAPQINEAWSASPAEAFSQDNSQALSSPIVTPPPQAPQPKAQPQLSPPARPAQQPPPAPPQSQAQQAQKTQANSQADLMEDAISTSQLRRDQRAPMPELKPRKEAVETAGKKESANAQGEIGVPFLFAKLEEYASKLGLKSSNHTKRAPEVTSTKMSLQQFLDAFDDAFKKLENGDLADANKLESVRLQLLQTLAPTTLGMELPCLQRFLRASGIELISSLKDKSVSLAELQEFWRSKQPIFEEIKVELADLLSEKEAAFWNSSI